MIFIELLCRQNQYSQYSHSHNSHIFNFLLLKMTNTALLAKYGGCRSRMSFSPILRSRILSAGRRSAFDRTIHLRLERKSYYLSRRAREESVRAPSHRTAINGVELSSESPCQLLCTISRDADGRDGCWSRARSAS